MSSGGDKRPREEEEEDSNAVPRAQRASIGAGDGNGDNTKTKRVVDLGPIKPIGNASNTIKALAAGVEYWYKPQKVNTYQLRADGAVVYCIDSDVCVVADLKLRTFSSGNGGPVPFPAFLSEISFAIVNEMQPGRGGALTGVFPAESATARYVLVVASTVFAAARVAPRLPVPGTAAVHYSMQGPSYEVALPDACSLDRGAQVLQVTTSCMTIRCKGKQCSAKGRRWERPSRSSKDRVDTAGWSLSFLFPSPAAREEVAVVAAVAHGFPSFATSPNHFLNEGNLLRALGFDDNGGPRTVYEDRFKQLQEWCALKQQEAGNTTVHQVAHNVVTKCRIMEYILCNAITEEVYRECLAVSPDFAYPIHLVPTGPVTLVCALVVHLARTRGYRRVGYEFHLAGRMLTMEQLVTSLFTFPVTPNICTHVLWDKHACDHVHRTLADPTVIPVDE